MLCTFPAAALVREMRRVSREADRTNDPAQIAYAAHYVQATNDLRIAHNDLTGCNCWFGAIDAVNAAEKP